MKPFSIHKAKKARKVKKRQRTRGVPRNKDAPKKFRKKKNVLPSFGDDLFESNDTEVPLHIMVDFESFTIV